MVFYEQFFRKGISIHNYFLFPFSGLERLVLDFFVSFLHSDANLKAFLMQYFIISSFVFLNFLNFPTSTSKIYSCLFESRKNGDPNLTKSSSSRLSFSTRNPIISLHNGYFTLRVEKGSFMQGPGFRSMFF